jgi:hypothetical protein
MLSWLVCSELEVEVVGFAGFLFLASLENGLRLRFLYKTWMEGVDGWIAKGLFVTRFALGFVQSWI